MNLRSYELAYHLFSDLEEAEVTARMQGVESLITDNGGSIVQSREPKKMHLSYPVNHKHYAHFGVLDFQAPAEMIEKLNAQMKLQDGVLRFLLISKPTEGGKELRVLGDQRARKAHMQIAPTHRPSTEPKVAPTEEKKIEKELEDVLEKI